MMKRRDNSVTGINSFLMRVLVATRQTETSRIITSSVGAEVSWDIEPLARLGAAVQCEFRDLRSFSQPPVIIWLILSGC